jgi:hypothetical protein
MNLNKEDLGMVTIEQMVGPYLRAGRLGTPEEQGLSAAAVLRAMRKRSSYSHCDDDLFFQDLLVEVRFGTDYSIEQCKSFRDRILSLWLQLDARASTPNAESLRAMTRRSTSTRLRENEVWRYDQTCNVPDHSWVRGYSYERAGKVITVCGHWRKRRPSKTSLIKKAA